MTKRHTYWSLHKIVRGFSNHRRIEIMDLLYGQPGLSLIDIARALHVNFKTASEHTRRLTIAGLAAKHSDGASVRHNLSPRGTAILMFLRTLE